MYRIGIDAGSKTIKLVVIDDEGKVVHSLYRRHGSNIRRTLSQVIDEYLDHFGNAAGPVAVTGSAGIAVASALGLPFVQEVVATTDAVKQEYPEANAVIELGGEDAKVVYLDDPIEQRMNATCAGGTGGFIDTFATMMGIRASEVNLYALRAKHVYPISHRCAVFAQSDVRPLLAAGVSKEDMAASVLEAVVKQTIGGLACGRPIRGNVVFLGGPLEFIPELYRRFCVALELDRDTGVKPHRANLFTARGAAIGAGKFADEQKREGATAAPNESSIMLLKRAVQDMPEIKDDLARMAPLFANADERAQFEKRHANAPLPSAAIGSARGPLYLGIDAGSTTVKYALVDDEGRVLSSDCREAEGDALLVAGRMLDDLYNALPAGGAAYIAQAVITGNGDEILESGLKMDASVVDMTAFLRAARELYPQASFVLDIGGQDMKGMWVKDGQMIDAILNEPCSSGCGEFIADTARAMEVPLDVFTTAALEAKRPVELDTKCTVFMTSRVRHAQKVGASDADISAGIAYSIVRNALYRVIARAENSDMGDTVVVGGGAFRSDAVLRAFELVSGKNVIRPASPHLLGAYGAALIARDRAHEAALAGQQAASSLVGADMLASFDPVYSAYRCDGCEKSCMLSLVDFGDGRVFVSGNRCSEGARIVKDAISAIGEDEYLGTTSLLPRSHHAARPKGNGDIGFGIQIPGFLKSFSGGMVGGGGSSVQKGSIYYEEARKRTDAQVSSSTRITRAENVEVPNVVARERELLAAFDEARGIGARGKLKVGIVNTLTGFEQLPFWHTLFTQLGYSVVVSDETRSTSLKTMSAESIPSESVCESAKITHERVYDLARQGARVVFMPRYERNGCCAVRCQYVDAIADNVPFIGDGFVKVMAPELRSQDAEGVVADEADRLALLAAFEELSGVAAPNPENLDAALKVAAQAQAAFVRAMREATDEALAWVAADESRHGVVVAGRPYHMDSELAHDVDNVLQKLGVAVLAPLGVDAVLDERAAEGEEGYMEALRAEDDVDTWRHAGRLARYARFVADNPQLDVVVLESFNCGYDAVNVGDVRSILVEADRPFTVLKIDDIVDAAHIAVRLRTLVESVVRGGTRDGRCELGRRDTRDARKGLASPFDGNASVRQEGESVDLLAEGLSRADMETARASVSFDLCFTAAIVVARAINVLRKNPSIDELRVPDVCHGCLIDALPHLLQREFGTSPRVVGGGTWGANARLPREAGVHPVRSRRSRRDKVRIGIVGNPLLCFDPFMNEGVEQLVRDLGAEPVMPDPDLVNTDDVRYFDQLSLFSKTGVSAVLYLQSFSCLKGHVQARGALHSMRSHFPEMPVTVIDYDPESSELNRENRIRLVVATAKQRAAEGPKFGGLPARFRRAACIEVLDEFPFYRNTRSVNFETMRNPYGAGAGGTPDYEILKEASNKDYKMTAEMAAAIRAVMVRGR